MDVMASSQEVCSEGWVMQESLEDDSLITGLSHVPDTTSTTTRARVLVSIVLNVDLGNRVLDPSAFAIYQMISCSVDEKGTTKRLGLTLVLELAGRATEPFQPMIIDKIDTGLTKHEAIA